MPEPLSGTGINSTEVARKSKSIARDFFIIILFRLLNYLSKSVLIYQCDYLVARSAGNQFVKQALILLGLVPPVYSTTLK